MPLPPQEKLVAPEQHSAALLRFSLVVVEVVVKNAPNADVHATDPFK